MDVLVILVPLAAIAALVAGFLMAQEVLAAPSGDARMNEIAGAVRQGASAYMNRQYRTIFVVAIVIVALFALVAYLQTDPHEATMW